MTMLNSCTVTPIQKSTTSENSGVLDSSKNNRTPTLSSDKLFEVKYSECYGNNFNIDELKKLAIFDILAYDLLTEKQLVYIQKNIDTLNELSFEDIDMKRNECIMKNKRYIDPEYKLISYHFLKNKKLNIVYEHKNEYDAFIMILINDSIEDTINHYNEKIAKFKETNSFSPRDWTIRIAVLNQILDKIK